MSTVRNLSDDLEVTDLNGFTDVDVYIRLKDKSSGKVYVAIKYRRESLDLTLDFLKRHVLGMDPTIGTIYYRPSLRSLDHLPLHRGSYVLRLEGGTEFFTEHPRWIRSRFNRV